MFASHRPPLFDICHPIIIECPSYITKTNSETSSKSPPFSVVTNDVESNGNNARITKV